MSRGRWIWSVFVILVVVSFGLATGWRLLRPLPPAAPAISVDRPIAVINGVGLTQAIVDREVRISRLNVTEPLPPLTGADLDRA